MFSSTTRHAFRALAVLARQPDGETVLGRDLAVEAGVPSNYLSKILLSLNRAGLIHAVRGLGGGYRLRRPADEIRLAEIVDVFEPRESRSFCLLGNERECSEKNPCSAHDRWGRVKEVYLTFTEGTTLAEISSTAN